MHLCMFNLMSFLGFFVLLKLWTATFTEPFQNVSAYIKAVRVEFFGGILIAFVQTAILATMIWIIVLLIFLWKKKIACFPPPLLCYSWSVAICSVIVLAIHCSSVVDPSILVGSPSGLSGILMFYTWFFILPFLAGAIPLGVLIFAYKFLLQTTVLDGECSRCGYAVGVLEQCPECGYRCGVSSGRMEH